MFDAAMSRRLFSSVCAMAFASLVASAPCRATEAEVPSAVPTPRVGDRWTYERTGYMADAPKTRFDVRISNVDPDGAWIEERVTGFRASHEDPEVKEFSRRRWTKDNSPVWPKWREAEGEWPILDFPLAVGKSWKFAFRIESGNGRWYQQGTAEVLRRDRLLVGSEEFEVFVVRHQYNGGFVSREYRVDTVDDFWFAPKLGRVVRRVHLARERGNGNPSARWDDRLVALTCWSISGPPEG